MTRLAQIVCALALLAAPATAQEATAEFGTGTTPFLIRSTTDIAILAPAITAFAETAPDLAITYEQWGSNALHASAAAACDGDLAPSDVVFSSAVHLMVSLVNRACARPYLSESTRALPPTRRWRDEIWGVTQEPAVMIYNTDLVAPEDVPQSRFDLLDLMRNDPGKVRGRIATYDIEESGLGYLFAHIDSLEATTYGSLLEGFARSDAAATCCSAEIIDGVSKGIYLIAYNVLGSYVENAAPGNVGVVLPDDYTLFLSRAYMIPDRAANPSAAEEFLDFLLSPQGQTILASVGLNYTTDEDEEPAIQSARRSIPLGLPLLVALDDNTRQAFYLRWNDTFARSATP
ncbi:MAG: ABC transporter substrate-binding protein [Pseudomonadota bacterium]|nr:ABC transporter substrate-binding protein [Pseudomonadota bacterium]